MKYFLFYGTEDGIQGTEFLHKEDVRKYIKDYFPDCPIKFLEKYPNDNFEFYDRIEGFHNLLLIKGECIQPKPIEIVKTYDFE